MHTAHAPLPDRSSAHSTLTVARSPRPRAYLVAAAERDRPPSVASGPHPPPANPRCLPASSSARTRTRAAARCGEAERGREAGTGGGGSSRRRGAAAPLRFFLARAARRLLAAPPDQNALSCHATQLYTSTPHTHAHLQRQRDKNPHQQIVGPTLGAVMGIVSAVVLWPVGAAVYVCSRPGGRSLFRTPGVVYSRVATPIPI